MAVILNPFVVLCKNYNTQYDGVCVEIRMLSEWSFASIHFHGPFKTKEPVSVEKENISDFLMTFFQDN